MAVWNKTKAIQNRKDEIQAWLDEGKSQAWISDQLGVSRNWIRRNGKKIGLTWNSKTGPRCGDLHPQWRGGRRLRQDGYYELYQPDHPDCQRSNANRNHRGQNHYNNRKYVMEHRIVMEKHLGRYLDPKEVVHHRNGDRTDNRIENLVLFSENSEHLRQELKGKCPKWTERGKENLRRIAQIRAGKPLNESIKDDSRYKALRPHLITVRDTSSGNL